MALAIAQRSGVVSPAMSSPVRESQLIALIQQGNADAFAALIPAAFNLMRCHCAAPKKAFW